MAVDYYIAELQNSNGDVVARLRMHESFADNEIIVFRGQLYQYVPNPVRRLTRYGDRVPFRLVSRWCAEERDVMETID